MTNYKYFSYTLTPQTRVSVGHGGEVRFLKRMEKMIRGTVVRGALGAAWWNGRDPGAKALDGLDLQSAFNDVFGGQLHVRQAVPTFDGKAAAYYPVSSYVCKYRPEQECSDFTEDVAIDAAVLGKCPVCGNKLAPGKGWKIPSAWYGTVTTTALTERGVAKHQNLFSRQVYKKKVVFEGTVRIETNSPYLQAVERWLTTDRRISIGGKKSVLGRVAWDCKPADAPPIEEALGSNLVAVRLLSPTILVDELGFPVLDLKRWLQNYRNRRGAQGEVLDHWIRTSQESGWNSIAGMPKPTDWALKAGSVALLQDWGEEELREIAQGIGLRQNEGFGEVMLVKSEATKRGS